MAILNLMQLNELLNLDKEEFFKQYNNGKVQNITKYNNVEVFMIFGQLFDMKGKVKIFFNFDEHKVISISIVRQDAFYQNGKSVYDSFNDFEYHITSKLGKPKKFYGKKYKHIWKTNFCIVRHEIIDRFAQQEELVFLPRD